MVQFEINLNELDEDGRQDQVKIFLEAYKLSQYYETFINEGFDRLLSLYDITETDLISLNVKRGHRRLLQRAIATSRGIPISTPILINYGYDEPDISHMPKPGTPIIQESDYPRYYRRKRHQYIPSKPVTAFDEYLDQVRQEYDGQMLSSQITLIAYERWHQLGVVEKDKYEREALHANSDYVMDKFIFEGQEKK